MTARIGRNILSLGFSRIISGVILFFVYVQAITYLGPDGFGKFSLVLAYYTIFSLLVDFGISKFVVKKVSEDRSLASPYLGNYLFAQLFLGLLVLGLFLVIPQILDYERSVFESMLLAGTGLLLISLSLPYSAIVQAWQQINVVSGINFLNTLINSVWLGLAIIFEKNVQFIFLLYPILGAVDLILYAFFASKYVLVKWQIDKKLLRTLFFFGAPFAFIAGFEILIQKIDVVIQKNFLAYSQVGLYSGAYRFVDFLTFIPAVVTISLFPALSERKDWKLPEVSEILNHLNRYLVALALPLGVGATLLAKKIILTLFDERFLGSIPVFQILIWSTVLTLIYAVPNVIMLVKRTQQTLVILGAVTIFNSSFNWFLIPKWGIVASAWITVVSYLLVAGSYIYFAKREAIFSIFRHFRWPVLGTIIMAVTIYPARELNIFLVTGTSLIVYFGFLYLVKFIQKEDLNFLRSLFIRESH